MIDIYYTVAGVWEAKKEEYISFANEVLSNTEDIRITFYMMCFLTCLIQGKDRYALTNDLIQIMLAEHKNIFNYENEKLVERVCLKNLVELSSQMRILMEQIAEVLYNYIDLTNNLHSFMKPIEHLLSRINNGELNTRFNKLYEEKVAYMVSKKATTGLKQLFDELSEGKVKIFDSKTILQPLAHLLLEQGKEGAGIMEIMLLNDSIEAFIKLGDMKKETEALGVLEKAIASNTIDWHITEVKLNEEEMKDLQKFIDLQSKFLNETNLAEIIRGLDKIISYSEKDFLGNMNKIVVYRVCPNYKMILNSNKNSITDQIFTGITLADNRIVSQREKESKNKGLYYENSFRFNVLPVLSYLEKYNILFLAEIRKLISESDWISDDIRTYYLRIEKYYSIDKAFEFMHFGVILIEMLLRDIYKVVVGTKIVSMRTDSTAQLNINLQEIMRMEEIRNFLGENLFNYLDYSLINDTGLNLRNNILHGLVQMEIFHHNYSRIIMHIILVIISHADTKFKENEW